MMRFAVLLVAASLAFSAAASAQKRTLSISHFYGKFSGGDVNKPRKRKKGTSRTFVAGTRPGMFNGTTSGDPLAGKELSWARIKENVLIVYLMVIDKDGAYQLQRYERKLVGTGMELTFTRLKDGEKIRTVKGRLIKTGR